MYFQQEPHSVIAEDLPDSISKAIQPILSKGYAGQFIHSVVVEPGSEYKTGAKAGQKRPDKVTNFYACYFRGAIYASWHNTKLNVWTNGASFEQFRYDVSSLKKYIKEVLPSKTPLDI